MTNPIDFLHGSSFANALNSIAAGHLAGLNADSRRMLLGHINDLLEMVENRNLTIERQNATIDSLNANSASGLGFIRLLEEEIEKLRAGVVSENRLSGNNQLRKGIRDELENLAAKVDDELACRGGRFSGNRIQNLRDVLHMRIDEFFEYGKEHGLIHPDAKMVYNDEILKSTYDTIDMQINSAGTSPETLEVVLLQRVMNKNYALAADAAGNKPEGYPFKLVNLIAAVGFTVKQLCDHCNVDETPFVGHKYTDPAPEDYGRDPANDGAAALLQLEYRVLEEQADNAIKSSGLANSEELISRANARHTDIKLRLAAKMAIVRFAEVQADLFKSAN
jgi:hypothetical protein